MSGLFYHEIADNSFVNVWKVSPRPPRHLYSCESFNGFTGDREDFLDSSAESQKESESEDVGEVQRLAGGRFWVLFKMEYF